MFIRLSQNKEQSIYTYFIKASNKHLECFLNCYVFKWCLLNVEGFLPLGFILQRQFGVNDNF